MVRVDKAQLAAVFRMGQRTDQAQRAVFTLE
jgi:hypothetical protein